MQQHAHKKVHHKPAAPKNTIMAEKLAEIAGELDLADKPIAISPEDHRAAQIAHAAAVGDIKPETSSSAPTSPWKKAQGGHPGKPRYTEEEKALFNLRRRIQALEEDNKKINEDMDSLIQTCQAALDEAAERELSMKGLMEKMRQAAIDNLAVSSKEVDLTELKAELRQELLAALQGDMMSVLEELAASAIAETSSVQVPSPVQTTSPVQTISQALTAEEILANYRSTTPFYKRPSVQGATVGVAAGCAAAYGLKRMLDSLDSQEC